MRGKPQGTAVNMLDIRQRWGQRRLDGTIDATVWAYQVGRWAMVSPENRPQSAALASTVLGYNWRTERWEKRLGYWAIFHLRMNRAATPVNGTVESILQQTNLTNEIDERHPARTRKAFETALKNLKRDGVIDDWSYYSQAEIPRYGWLSTWLQWGVEVVATSFIRQHYDVYEQRRQRHIEAANQRKDNADAFAERRMKRKGKSKPKRDSA